MKYLPQFMSPIPRASSTGPLQTECMTAGSLTLLTGPQGKVRSCLASVLSRTGNAAAN